MGNLQLCCDKRTSDRLRQLKRITNMSKVSRFINHLRSPLWKVNVDEEVDTELD
jgi:hypothetical protein